MRPHNRALLLALAVLLASLAATPSSQAATSKQCKRLAGKAKVIVKARESMVVSRGNANALTLTYYTCLYARPRLYKLPGQNGGDTEFYGKFTPAGRYLAYSHLNQEQAAVFSPGFVQMVNLKRRKRVFQYDAFPVGPTDEET